MPVHIPQNIKNIDVLHLISAFRSQGYPFFSKQSENTGEPKNSS